MDLMSFMEFQQSFRAAQKSHTACLEITQRFWRNVARKEVTFKSMADHVRRIVVVETNTMRLYKVLLERYPSSVKVLRSYGKYLEEILCNPWKAMRLYNLADKTEDMAADRKRERLLTSTGEPPCSAPAVPLIL